MGKNLTNIALCFIVKLLINLPGQPANKEFFDSAKCFYIPMECKQNT